MEQPAADPEPSDRAVGGHGGEETALVGPDGQLATVAAAEEDDDESAEEDDDDEQLAVLDDTSGDAVEILPPDEVS